MSLGEVFSRWYRCVSDTNRGLTIRAPVLTNATRKECLL
jgi:hypothetical protein